MALLFDGQFKNSLNNEKSKNVALYGAYSISIIEFSHFIQ